MRTITSQEVARDVDKLLESSRHQPIRVIGAGQLASIVLSETDYERLRSANRDRLKASLDRLHKAVGASGLGDATIEQMIADEA